MGPIKNIQALVQIMAWRLSGAKPLSEPMTASPTHAYRHHSALTHWGRVTHIFVIEITIIGPDDGLSPEQRQAIIWSNAGILLIGALETNFSEILVEIITFHST